MMREISCLVLLLLFLTSCEEEERHYDPPVIVSPFDGQTYYPDQLIRLKWIVPDSNQITRVQQLWSQDSEYFENEDKLFDTLTTYSDFSNQSKAEFHFVNGLPWKEYTAFRLKYIAKDGSSKWSQIVHYQVFPISELTLIPLEIKIRFKFFTEHGPEYYSGLTESLNNINIDSIISANGHSLSKLRFIKPGSGSINDAGIHANHFDQFTFGVNIVNGGTYPFDPLGSADGGFQVNEILFSTFGGMFRDLYLDFGKGRTKVILAYRLSSNRPFSQEIGIEHELEMILNINCYFEK